MKELLKKYRELLLYLVFGGVTTLVNIVSYALLSRTGMPTALSNGIALALSILTAYITNRVWVFRSHATGMAAFRELVSFVGCRLGTGVLDEIVMVVGVDVLGLWSLGVKVFSNVLVIVANYVFSKLIIFKKK